MIPILFLGAIFLQVFALKLSFAAATALSMSFSFPAAHVPQTSLVAGLMTSIFPPSAASTYSPLMKHLPSKILSASPAILAQSSLDNAFALLASITFS